MKKASYKNNEKYIMQLKKRISIEKKGDTNTLYIAIERVLLVFLILSLIGTIEGTYYVKHEEINSEYKAFVEEYDKKKAEKEKILKEKQLQQQLTKEQMRLEEELSSKEENILPSINNKNGNDYIASLLRHPQKSLEKRHTDDGKEYWQYTGKIDLDEYYVTDSGTDVIYPGAIIKGDSLFTNNAYTLISEERTPIYLTSNHEDGDSIKVENPNHRTVSDTLKEFQSRVNSQNAKEWTYQTKIITSTEELNATLGLKGGNTTAQVGIDVGYDASKESSTIAVIFTQIFYTISMEPHSDAMDYFEKDVNLSKLGLYEPAYISSVDYGRMVTMFVTANMSSQELNAKVNAAVSQVGLEAGFEKIQKEDGLEISYRFYGGNTSDVSAAVDEKKETEGIWNTIKEFVDEYTEDDDTADAVTRINEFIGSNKELVNPVPISYEMKYLSDNAMVPKMSITQEKAIADQNIKIVSIKLDKGADKNFEIYFPNETLKLDETSFLWHEDTSAVLKVWFDGKPYEIQFDNQNVQSVPLGKKGNLIITVSEIDKG